MKDIVGLPDLPFFVVITITPFAALEPHKDAAEALASTLQFDLNEHKNYLTEINEEWSLTNVTREETF